MGLWENAHGGKKNHYPGSAAFEFPATKASCLQVQDPGCLSQGLWEAHPHASVSHLPLTPAVAGATPLRDLYQDQASRELQSVVLPLDQASGTQMLNTSLKCRRNEQQASLEHPKNLHRNHQALERIVFCYHHKTRLNSGSPHIQVQLPLIIS